MAGNNPAVLRLKAYIEANGTTEAQLLAAADVQWLAVMYPDSEDNEPYHDTPGDAHNWITVALAKRYLKQWYQERRAPALKAEAVALIEAAGWEVVEVDHNGGQVTVTMEKV
jgi:hypothetical protein